MTALKAQLEGSLAVTPPTMESIAQRVIRATERDTLLRKFSRYCRDAAMFADRNQLRDADLAFEKARQLFDGETMSLSSTLGQFTAEARVGSVLKEALAGDKDAIKAINAAAKRINAKKERARVQR